MSAYDQADVTLYVDGISLDTVVPWGDIEITDRRPGNWAASWTMSLPPGDRPELFRRGALVEAYAGTRLRWSGIHDEPDWNSGTFSAIGIARAGEGAECLTAGGAVTSRPNTALDYAGVRGVTGWLRGRDFGNDPVAGPEGTPTTSDPDPGKLVDLLDARSVKLSGETSTTIQWYVTPEGLVDQRTENEDATAWIVLPGATELGVASDNVTDRVFLRFADSTAGGVHHTVSYPGATPRNGIERKASIVQLGPITPTDALDRAEGMYRRALAGRTGWSNGLTLRAGQVIDTGGLWADLSMVRPGQALRVMDQRDPRGVAAEINVLVDETVWRPGRREIQVNPIGLAARTWEQVMEEAMATAD
ncbi:hypothetical protein [Nocardioides sp. L-11A]|uniref:hypothetical protein n=1 Tax=Nocardioides sp. L-11A TaxID=3043848 RepID=UPI00249C528F|nr:hypothetical protein QJ852_09775 [Nocardioides sp. L-11A]